MLATARGRLADAAGLSSVRSATSPDAPVVEIVATGSDARHTTDLANAVAGALADYASQRSKQTSVKLSVLAPATVPTRHTSPRPPLELVIGAAAGLLLGGLAALGSGGRDEPPPARGRAVRAPAPVLARPTLGDAATPDDPRPLGASGTWRLAFGDEFDGVALDPGRWSDNSSAEADAGRANPGNEQLEWNRAANCRVGGGLLTMTARREPVTSPASGRRYGWTSCLISSAPAYSVRYGFLEERAVLPVERGFWPAFWTWQAPGVDRHVETDVYEYYSDNPGRLYGTQFSGAGGRCEWRPPFHPAGGWHTYGVAIEPASTTWYVDGTPICRTAATADAPTAVISNLAVYSRIPPGPGTNAAVKLVDYIRVWTADSPDPTR